MKRKSTTYRILTKAVAVFLLLGMLFPSAIQAKQLVDFCMMEMEMSHHEMMDGPHDCCEMSKVQHDVSQKNHHNCDDMQICACSVDTTLAENQFRVPTAKSSAVILSQSGFNFMVTSPDEFIYEDYFADARQHSPPLYLLNDTFLN